MIKHHFTVIEDQDAPLAIAVGAYLDCEHYIYLHKSLMKKLEVVWHDGLKTRLKQTLTWFGLTMTQEFTLEYVPPGHFKSYDIVANPWWMPSVHHLVKNVAVDVHYKKHPEKDTTLMQFDVSMDIHWWAWPLRKVIQKLMEDIHHLKDQEDLHAIKRRADFYGRRNNSSYLVDYQFLLHKDEYMKWFGPNCEFKCDSALY